MNSAILDRLQLGLVLLALSGMASGDLVIRVTQGNDSPTKIAIAPIANAGAALTEDMARIIEADLQRLMQISSVRGRAKVYGLDAGSLVIHCPGPPGVFTRP